MLSENHHLNAGLRNGVAALAPLPLPESSLPESSSRAGAFPNGVWEREGAGRKTRAAFTLVELVLVMALMVMLVAFVAPSLRNSFKHRALDQEATRLVALTEYARNEAVSQGIPTEVWLDAQSGSYGAEAMPGYDNDKTGSTTTTTMGAASNATPITGVEAKDYTLPGDQHFEVTAAGKGSANGHTQMIQFDPDGAPTAGTGITSVRVADQDNRSSTLTLTTDGWGYQITTEDANAQGH